uniref:Uncharacterized protein n=1 Tax=Megaselia scalaris TaxID=36166 RepID=T1H5V9_MEGSC
MMMMAKKIKRNEVYFRK